MGHEGALERTTFHVTPGIKMRLCWRTYLAMAGLVFLTFLFPASLVGLSPMAHLSILMSALFLAAVVSILPVRVTLGDDGIHLRWLFESRFVRYREIDRIRPDERGLVIELHSREGIPLLTTNKIPANEHQRLEAVRIVALVESAFHAAPPEESNAIRKRPIEQHTPVTAEMVRTLRAQTQGTAGYREKSVPRDELIRIALDPSTEEKTRIAAAIASFDPADAVLRDKLHAAGTRSASPRVRLAFDRLSAAIHENDVEALLKKFYS